MTLQILVNHYKENEEIVDRFLSSLAMQRGVEFEVFLCSDGGIQLNPALFDKYPYEIHYEYLYHTGVCHTRNVMMDMASADYLMFCDVDDCFSSPDGLVSLMRAAERTQSDVIGSPYQCEHLVNGSYEYVTYRNDTIRVHGKIFRRDYLVKNQIRFPDELETSGDMSFLWLAYALTDKAIWIPDNFYIWKWNASSVTRSDPYSQVMMYERTIRCFYLLAKDLQRRNRPELLRNLVATTVATMYVDTTHLKWKQAPKEYQDRAINVVREYLREYGEFYESIDEDYRRSKYDLMLNYKRAKGFSGSFEGIGEWVRSFLECKNSETAGGILIIGCGTVGSNLEKELHTLKPDKYDKFKNIDTREKGRVYDVAFVCVDTPLTPDCNCDISEVRNAIMENDAAIFVIKSTVLPGTTEKLTQDTGKRIIFSPEYYGGTQHCNNYSFPFTILGGEKVDCIAVIQLLQRIYDGTHQFRMTSARTAELVKYMENSYLAMKVSFCNQFADIAQRTGVCYEELRELFVLDPRVNPSHTFLYRGKPYWDSHCLNKDVRAIAEAYNAPLLLDMIIFNEDRKAAHERRPKHE